MRSTTSQRTDTPISGGGIGLTAIGRPSSGVPGATCTRTSVPPALGDLPAISTRIVPGGSESSTPARPGVAGGSTSGGARPIRSAGPGTRSSMSRPFCPGRSVCTTNRPSSPLFGADSRNGARARSATASSLEPHCPVTISRLASSPAPRAARVQLPIPTSRHFAGSGTVSSSNRSTIVYSAGS